MNSSSYIHRSVQVKEKLAHTQSLTFRESRV